MSRGRTYSSQRGVTLVEAMVFVSIWASVAGTTLYAIQQAAMTRGQAQQAAELALIAQSELEHARAIPAGELRAGTTDISNPTWPAGTSCTLTLAPHSAKTWQVNVEVGRTTARTLKPVRLATFRRAQL